ncbi:Ig-like domain-containing protein [Brevundimonas sp.]|uniref:RHS repeat domain-containing protein n=1 Tax=Brevundimonas sp. TaxID=1871086 RepID=UPI0025BF76CE|nr:Ig-like domain-containing protein [Brevundimonas sp.]
MRHHQRLAAVAALAAALGLPASVSAGTQYQYDTQGRLIRVAYDNGVVVQYSYDAAGNRSQVAVSGVNRPPVAVNDSANATASAWVDIMVRANDSDPDGDNLTVTAVGTPTGGGAVAIQGGGTHVRYTAPATTGAKSFTYTVSDGRGGIDTATVTVNVGAANRAPVAVNDSASVNASASVDIMVRANDSDPDGDPLTVTAVGAPSGGGTVAIQSGGTHVRYTAPATGGAKSFTYTVSDGRGGTDVATVSVNVIQANRPPVAVNDQRRIEAFKSANVYVLSNDSDPDGDPLTITSVTGSGASIGGGGAYIAYSAGGIGLATVQYTISDGRGGTASATLEVDVYRIFPGDPWPELQAPETSDAVADAPATPSED